MFTRLHHVQLAMPPGREYVARDFYAGALGMEELSKPPSLAARGGAWFRLGGVDLHLGVDDDFRPARRGHPGVLVEDIEAVASRLSDSGHEVTWDDRFPGFRRFYAHDPFGNRLEFLQAE